MCKTKLIKTFFLVCSLMSVQFLHAQEKTAAKKTCASVFDGIVVGGYVNDGAYLNFTGPSIKWVKKPCSLILGLLPSIRIKEDKVVVGAKKNSIVTPTLGAGVTFVHKHFAVQIPLYYNAKTTSANGKWNVGVGIGYKF